MMKKLYIKVSMILMLIFLSTSYIFCQTSKKNPSNNNKQNYIPKLGDIGDLSNGEGAGDPPICSTFVDIDKWNKFCKTNDDFLIKDINSTIFYFNVGDRIRITDFQESKWGKCFEFRVINGENIGKIGWGRIQDFRLIKSKAKQDKEAELEGE